jgi:hypothetical protein
MTDEEKKKYVIQNIKTSSGERITQMVSRYFKQTYFSGSLSVVKENISAPATSEQIVNIFGGDLTN